MDFFVAICSAMAICFERFFFCGHEYERNYGKLLIHSIREDACATFGCVIWHCTLKRCNLEFYFLWFLLLSEPEQSLAAFLYIYLWYVLCSENKQHFTAFLFPGQFALRAASLNLEKSMWRQQV
jgi:hypothetical protein